MFPRIDTSTSTFCIVLPSYDPLIHPYTWRDGATETSGIGLRSDRNAARRLAESRETSHLWTDERSAMLGSDSEVENRFDKSVAARFRGKMDHEDIAVRTSDGPGTLSRWAHWISLCWRGSTPDRIRDGERRFEANSRRFHPRPPVIAPSL